MKLRSQLIAGFALLVLLLPAPAQEKRLSIYAPQTSFQVAVLERGGREYVGLVDILEPLGKVSASQDGDKWKLRFNSSLSEFEAGDSRAKVRGKKIDLGAPFLLENDRGLIPLSSLATVLSRWLTPVDFRQPARRLFIGTVGTQFTADMQKNGPSRLVLNFSAPVNPTIATEPGHLRMTFVREPVIATTAIQSFNDKLITGATFAEHNGAAEIAVSATAPLQATFNNGGRSITISAAPQVRVQAPPPPPAPPIQSTAPAPAPVTAPAAPHPHFLVVIDPGHGGDDRGATLAGNIAEKDVTLAWARRLRAALERQGIAATLLRDSDVALTLEQRAVQANAARPAVFITLHATTGGSGIRIYTAHLPDSGLHSGSFLPWEQAQATFLDASRALAGSIAAELSKREVQVATAPVLMRPLNNVAAPAVALEVMPAGGEVVSLLAPGYQQSVCAAVANGIAAVMPGRTTTLRTPLSGPREAWP